MKKRGNHKTLRISLVLIIILVLPSVSAVEYLQGDFTGDGEIDISDPIALLNYLFRSGSEPKCALASDANDDGKIDISDPVFLLQFLFLGGPEPLGIVPDYACNFYSQEFLSTDDPSGAGIPEGVQLSGGIFCDFIDEKKEEVGIYFESVDGVKYLVGSASDGKPDAIAGEGVQCEKAEDSLIIVATYIVSGNKFYGGQASDYIDLNTFGNSGIDFQNQFGGGAGENNQKIPLIQADGKENRDYIKGSYAVNNELYGSAGDDIIIGALPHPLVDLPIPIMTFGGDDIIYGGTGNDLLIGESKSTYHVGGFNEEGDDIIYGGTGNDVISGAGGDDFLFGGDGDIFNDFGDIGDDFIAGGKGLDIIFGEGGDDIIAGSGNMILNVFAMPIVTPDIKFYWIDDQPSVIFGGEGEDFISGSNQDDIIFGNEDHDELMGSGGSDIVFGGEGDDKISGQYTDSRLFIKKEDLKKYDGSDGNDLLFGDWELSGIGLPREDDASPREFYEALLEKMRSDPAYQSLQKGDISIFEESTPPILPLPIPDVSYDDLLVGGCENDILIAGPGDDGLFGSDFFGFFVGECIKDNDWLFAGAGDDGHNAFKQVIGGTGNDIVFGGSGDDELYGDFTPEDVQAEKPPYKKPYQDLVCGGSGRDEIFGDTPGYSEGASDHLISGLRPNDDTADPNEEFRELVCDSSYKYLVLGGGIIKTECEDTYYRQKDKDYYSINGLGTEYSIFDPTSYRIAGGVLPNDLNDYDGHSLYSTFDEAYNALEEEAKKNGQKLDEMDDAQIKAMLAAIFWEGKKLCRDNWKPSDPGEKCQLAGLNFWGPLTKEFAQEVHIPELLLKNIKIGDDEFQFPTLPDCAIYGPSGSHKIDGGENECRQDKGEVCCICEPPFCPQAGWVPQCSPTGCGAIWEKYQLIELPDGRKVPTRWKPDIDTYQCNIPIHKKRG